MTDRPAPIHPRADPTVLHCCQCDDKRNLPRPVREQKDPRRNAADAVRAALRDGRVVCGNCRHEPCGRCTLLDARQRPIKRLGGANLLPDRFAAHGWRCAHEQCGHVNAPPPPPLDHDHHHHGGFGAGDALLLRCAAARHDPAQPVWFSPLAAVVNRYGEDLAALRTDRLKLRDGPLREHLRDFARREGKRRVEEDQGPAAAPQAFGYRPDGEYMAALRAISQSLRAFLADMDRGWRTHLEYMAEKARETAQAPTQRAHLSVRPYQPGLGPDAAAAAAAAAAPSLLPRLKRGRAAITQETATVLLPPSTAPMVAAGAYVPAAGYVDDGDDDGMYDDYPEDDGGGGGDNTPGGDGPTYETPLTSYSSGSTYQTAGPDVCPPGGGGGDAAGYQATPAASVSPAYSLTAHPYAAALGAAQGLATPLWASPLADGPGSVDTVMADDDDDANAAGVFHPPTPQWSVSSARSPEEVLQNYYDASAVSQGMAHGAAALYQTPAAGAFDYDYQDPGHDGYLDPTAQGANAAAAGTEKGKGGGKGKKGKGGGTSPEMSKKDGKKKPKKN